MLLHGAFSQIACAFGPYCLLHVIITKMRRPGLCMEALLSRTAGFPGQGLLGLPSWDSSPVGCGLLQASGFLFLCFLQCPVQYSAGNGG